MMRLSQVQKLILEMLLDRYENSKTYAGTNQLTQHFRVRPAEVWAPYTDPFTDVGEVEDFERQAQALVEQGLILTEQTKDSDPQIKAFVALPEAIERYYSLLKRKKKQELLVEETELYRRYAVEQSITGAFCRAQLALLAQGKKASYQAHRARGILAALERIVNNTGELYERELSIQVFHDSKAFEKSYRKTVCDILKRYGDFNALLQDETEERAVQQTLLESYMVYANPGYVYVKGAARILFLDGSEMEIKSGLPMALSSDFVHAVSSIYPDAERIMTIENLTSFHRFAGENYFCVFLSGYHSSRITQFLNLINATEKTRWFHFGDTDPDGFMILRHLCTKTGITFQPFMMDTGVLERYAEYGKPLEKQDITKAKTLIEAGFFAEVAEYMLERNIKLEQEAVTEKDGCTG